MNKLKKFLIALAALVPLAALALGCSLALQPKSAQRTLIGVSKVQVLAAAQQVAIDEGFDIQRADASTGLLVTAWLEHPHRAVRYEVTIESLTAEDGTETGNLSVAVAGTARDRIVGGWSADYPAGLESSELLDAISELAAARVAEQSPRRAAPRKPACRRSSDCPDGKLCGSGRCVAECTADADCEEGRGCDYKGRCVVPPAEPEPCPVPKCAPADAGAAATGEEVAR